MTSKTCLNCGAESGEQYCPICGQSMSVRLLSVGELLHGFFFVLATLALLASWLAALVPPLDLPIAIVTGIGWACVPVYAFVALRRVYEQGAVLTTVKLLSVGLIHLACFAVIFLSGLVLTAASI